MKKLITLFLALASGFGLKAQCPLTEAVDFTATDCHGTEVHMKYFCYLLFTTNYSYHCSFNDVGSPIRYAVSPIRVCTLF